MKQKTGIIHPNFILGLLTFVLLLAGIVINTDETDMGKILIVSSILLGGVHWIISMFDVWRDTTLRGKEEDNYFWLALVIMIPPMAGMMYYMINEKRVVW